MHYSMTLVGSVLLASLALTQAVALKNSVNLDQSNSEVGLVDTSNGLTVQSGYEGYLLSTSPDKPVGIHSLLLSKFGTIKSIVVPASKFLLAYGVKVAAIAIHVIVVLLVGFAATKALCTYTTVCATAGDGFNFIKGKFVKDQVKDLARTYMTPENMEYATKLVQSAFDKYQKNN